MKAFDLAAALEQLSRSSAIRPGVARAIRTILTRIAEGQKTTSVVLPTRYGKSDVIRIAAHLAVQAQLVSCALVIGPAGRLKKQIMHSARVAGTFERAGLDPTGFGMRDIDRVELPMRANEETFLSATTQLAHFYLPHFEQWLEHERFRYKLPILVFVDECDSVTKTDDPSKWGWLVVTTHKFGGHVCLLTAVEERSDGEEVPGFQYDANLVAEDIRWTAEPSPEGDEYVRVVRWMAREYSQKIHADVRVTFEEAWAERPMPLCHVARDPYEALVTTTTKDSVPLSEFSDSAAREAMGRVVRDPKVIADGVSRLVGSLRRQQAKLRELGAIVFCANDEPGRGGSNDHFRLIEHAFKMQAPEFTIIAATSDDDLDRFDQGEGDVLLVKQLGAVGYDIPRAKIALDLCPVLTYRAWLQRNMRVATIWGWMDICEWIYPRCVITDYFWIRTRGLNPDAETDVETFWRLEERLGHKDKLKEDKPSAERVLHIEGTDDSAFDDSAGHEAHAEEWQVVQGILDICPALGSLHTPAEIAVMFRGFMLRQSEYTGKARNIGDELRDLRAELAGEKVGEDEQGKPIMKGGLVQQLAYRISDRTGESFQTVLKRLWPKLKEAAGVSPNLELERICNVQKLREMKSKAIEWLRKEN